MARKWGTAPEYIKRPASRIKLGENGLPWAAFFQTAIKLFLHNLNRMLLVLLETEYNKVWLTSIKNSIFKRYIIVIFDTLKCCICHTVPYRWGPLCHSIGYMFVSRTLSYLLHSSHSSIYKKEKQNLCWKAK